MINVCLSSQRVKVILVLGVFLVGAKVWSFILCMITVCLCRTGSYNLLKNVLNTETDILVFNVHVWHQKTQQVETGILFFHADRT